MAQLISSLGDWIGVVAIAILAERVKGPTGVGIVMTARVLPGFLVGPVAGVIADRWDRRKTMVMCDILRAVLIFTLPLFPNIVYLLIASALLESLTLVWGPAKDASLPHVVPVSHLTHANSLNLIAVYGPWPVATVVFAGLTSLGGALADVVPVLSGIRDQPEALALWVDSATFCVSALLIWTLTIPRSRTQAGKVDMGVVWRDLVEGLRFVVTHRKVRPWIIGIAMTFTAAGGVFSLGVGFVKDVLDAGPNGFAFLIGFLGSGMIIGLLAVGPISKRVQKDVLFSGSILLLGVGLIALASMSSLDTAIPIASALGFFGGAAYSTGYSLMHENTEDELRGRTFSAAYTSIRIGTLVGLGLFPLVAGALGNYIVSVGDMDLFVPGTRATLWFAGLFALGGGVFSMRAIRERDDEAPEEERDGFFIAFEGGDGSGKTTQITALSQWLEEQGLEVVMTREPGGTAVGSRIRAVLLDPEAREMSERTEALLYAADRAQHVSEVIAPALAAGKVVLSDRFLDSSLAYQGIARGLGVERIFDISEWATGGVLPDLVFYLQLDSSTGLSRTGNEPDRIEQEGDDFHRRVASAYRELARRYPARFVVIDAARTPSEVHQQIVRVVEERRRGPADAHQASRTLGPPGPVAR